MDLESERLISAFRGLPAPKRLENRRRIKGLDGLIDKLIAKHKIEQPSMERTLMDNWRQIVGVEFAHRCSPQKILGDRLLISASNPVVRQELVFRKGEIVRRIRALPGCKAIDGVSFS